MLTDDGYRQLMKHAKRLAQEGHGELAQHLRDAIDLRAEVEALKARIATRCDFARSLIQKDAMLDMARAEVETLRADAQAIAALLPGPYYMDPPDGGDVPVIEQIRRMAVDAQRYRHMKSHALYQPASWGYYPASYLIRLWDNESKPLERATLDAYIDAARAAQGASDATN